MNEIKHILVPTDFGESAEQALELAADLSKKYGASITLLHTYEVVVYPYSWAAPVLADYLTPLRAEATRHLEAAAAELRKRVPEVQALLSHGAPWEQILEVAKKTNADLIVMGTHGRRGLNHVLLGSVAERVVRLSAVPVLTVRSPASA